MQTPYTGKIQEVISQFDAERSNKYFIFGSSVRKKRFHDIDLGVTGNSLSNKELGELREKLYDSSIPYKVDVVDIDAADEAFRSYVLENEPVIWIP